MSALLKLQEALLARRISASDLATASVARARAQVQLNATIGENFDASLAHAATLDLDGKWDAPLAGIPLAHKDVFCTQGVRTTAGSKILANFVPPYSATIVEKLAHSPCIAKANMDEFAMGSSNERSAYGACINPWSDHAIPRVPGGSSGGSAALVAARVVPFATASDTGGSIRQPAAFCGVTGIKPTYGLVSRWGMIAYASSLDQAGVIAESAADCAMVLQQMAGFDVRDSTSIQAATPDLLSALKRAPQGQHGAKLRIGVPRALLNSGVQSGVLAAFEQALAQLQALGHELHDIELPNQDAAISCYYVIAPCEASSNLSRYDGVRFGVRADEPKTLVDLYELSRSQGFGAEVQRRILIGTFALSAGYFDAYYLRAQKVRRLIAQDYSAAFAEVDVIATPSAPTVAYPIGSAQSDALSQYLADAFTVGVNLAGLPAIGLPCGFASDPAVSGSRLPVGLQLIGDRLKDAELLSLAHQYQQHTDFHLQRPLGIEAFSEQSL